MVVSRITDFDRVKGRGSPCSETLREMWTQDAYQDGLAYRHIYTVRMGVSGCLF